MKKLTINDVLKVRRPKLGETIPVSLWRILRLIIFPKVFDSKEKEMNRKLGLELGGLLNIRKIADITTAIEDA